MNGMRHFQNLIRYGLCCLCLVFCTATVSAQSAADKAKQQWDRMHEMAQTLPAPENVGRNPDVDLAALANLNQYRQHIESVAKEFAADIKADQQPFRNLGFKIEHLRTKLTDFDNAAKTFYAIESVQRDLEHVLKMANQAVKYNAPAYFRPENDIGRYTESAKLRIRYMQAADPKSKDLAEARKRLDDTTRQVKKIQQNLSASILEQNDLPPDEYRGQDREAILQLLRDKWNKEGTKEKVLKVGIVTPNWTRNVTGEIQNKTLYKNDRSRIQGYVIVQHSNKVAARHSIDLSKDHIDNDQISASFVNDPKEEPELIHQILLSKLAQSGK